MCVFAYFLCLSLVLPEQPIIMDRWGRQLNGSQLGPKQEGDDIVITCRVVGGKLSWLTTKDELNLNTPSTHTHTHTGHIRMLG